MLWNVAWERPVCEKSVSTTTSHVEDRLTPEGWLALVFGETCILPWQISQKKMLNRRQLLSQSWLCWVCPSRNRSGLDALPSNWAQGPVAETSPFVHRGPLTLYYDKNKMDMHSFFFRTAGKMQALFLRCTPWARSGGSSGFPEGEKTVFAKICLQWMSFFAIIA